MNVSVDRPASGRDAIFANAKAALRLIGQFDTPPTPAVYELWYHYVEAHDPELVQRMNYYVEDLQEVSASVLKNLVSEFAAKSSVSSEQEATQRAIASTLTELEQVARTQLDAGNEFSDSIVSAEEKLQLPSLTPNDILQSLSALAGANLAMRKQLAQSCDRLNWAQTQIQQLSDSLQESTRALLIDPLTNVGNRRHFDNLMHQIFERQSSDSKYTFLLLLDIDNFKAVNDALGHPAGDQLLRFVASLIENRCGSASVSRIGGDEFAIISRHDSAEGGKQLADDLVSIVNAKPIKFEADGMVWDRISVSVGVVMLRANDNAASLQERCDKLLYAAKEGGRNRACAERRITS